MPSIEILRMVTAYETVVVDIDDETLERVMSKTISRSELNDLCEDRYSDIVPLENEYPHTVYVINTGDHPITIDFEDEPNE